MKFLNPFATMPDNVLTRALKEGGWPLGFAAGFSVISNILYFALPIYTFQIYGRVLTSYSVPTLLVLTFGVIAVFVVSSVLDEFRSRVLLNYGLVLDRRVSSHVFAALFDLELRGQTQLRSQALRDLDQFRQVLTGQVFAALFDLPFAPIFLLVLFIIDPLVGAVTLVGGVLLVLIAFFQDRSARQPLREANEAATRGYGFTDAALRNSEVVRAMGMLEPLGRRWAVHRAESVGRTAFANSRISLLSNASKLTRSLIQVLVIGIGGYLVIKGAIHPGLLFANMILASRALQPIERLVGSWDGIVNGGRALDRLNILLTGYEAQKPATSLPAPLGRLSVENVNFAPPGAQRFVLQGVNFKLEPGEMLGVIGPSGAGKSTLARLIVGISKPNSGAIRLDGADVFTWSRAEFGAHVGYLPQDTELFAGSVRDNIARFRSDVTDEAVVAAARLANVHDLILRLPRGYESELGEAGHILSAGQRQRVGLARALLGHPRLLVLDEPNASLDAEGEDALMSVLDQMKASGTTIVVVSHKPNVFRAADKMLVLREGRMELFGPREQVMARFVQPAPVRPPIEAQG